MLELSPEYWNKLATQIILISSLLGGFSLAVLITLFNQTEHNRLLRNLQRAASIAAASFLIAIFSMTKILLMTTPGYPLEISPGEINLPRSIGGLAFFLGIFSLIAVISLSGWRKSRGMGRFTTIVGGISLLLIILVIS